MACQFDSRKPELVRNLLSLYTRQTIDADVAEGSRWYPEARRIVREWATTYCIHDATVACVIAAISPQCEWTRNLIIADDILAGRAVSVSGALHANIAKARRIIDDVAFSTMPYFPHGPKVASFAENLKGLDDYVTVDTHCSQAALGDAASTVTLRWQPYKVFAECYALAARRVNLPPATFQAIIWHTWKRLYPRIRKHAIRKQWEPIGEY